MTAQEQQLIDSLVQRIRNTPATDKDDEADRYLHQQLDTAPDALYVLAQTVLVQQYGLQNAQKQIADLQAQLDQAQQQAAQPKKSGSFLSHLLGADDQPQQQPQYQPVNTGYAATPPPPPPVGYAPVGYGAPVSYGSGGGFLRGALQTAAGVAAGEMFFQGMEGLFHGFGGGGYGYGGRPTEIIENNYYNDDRPHESEHHTADTGDGNFYNPSNDASRDLSPDIEDRRGFADTSANDTSGDDNFDDAGSDDSSSYDDSGDFDDGGGDFGGSDDSSF